MNTARQYTALAKVASPEFTHTIAVDIVPFGPAWRKIAELVAAGTRIPGFGDELGFGQPRIVADIE
jgi:hypothetical protein